MSATDELRRMLTEAGVAYRFNDATKVFEWHFDGTDGEGSAHATEVDGGINIIAGGLTPAQAIAATIGRGTLTAEQVSNATYAHSIHADCADADWQAIADELNAATLGRGECRKVYLVETSDDLYEGWYPMTVYLHRESAEDCAEALRKKEDGIWQFARVSELKVVDE